MNSEPSSSSLSQTPVPRIFVSTTSGDLWTVRSLVADAITRLGCLPVSQENFPPDYQSVLDMLRNRISECDAVLHFAGECYGAEPVSRPEGQDRRSFTQIEYEIAQEIGKPCYVFVLPHNFPYDQTDRFGRPRQPEPEEVRELQERHRAALLGAERVYRQPADHHELEKDVLALRIQVETLSRELAAAREEQRRIHEESRRGRQVLVRWLLALGACGALVGGGLYLRQRQTSSEVGQIGFRIDQVRAVVEEVITEEFLERSTSEGDPESQISSPTDRFEKAIERVAQERGLDAAAIKAELARFTEVIAKNRNADPLDQALARLAARDFDGAARQAEEAASALSADNPSERARLIAALRCAGDSHFLAGRKEESLNAYRQALALIDREKSPSDWLRLAYPLALSLNEEGHYEEALKLASDAILLVGRDESLGKDRLLAASMFVLLADVHRSRNSLNEAEGFFQTAFQIQVHELPPKDPTPIHTLNDLAAVHREQGNWDQAEEEHRLVLDRFLSDYGEDNLAVAEVRAQLGLDLQGKGQFDEARRQFDRSIRTRKALLSPQSPAVLLTRYQLGVLLGEEGRWSQGIFLLNQVLDDQRRVIGPDHIQTLQTAYEIASQRLQVGEITESENLIRQTLAQSEKQFGPDHVLSMKLTLLLARALLAKESPDEAASLLEPLLQRPEHVLPYKHPNRLTGRRLLGEIRLKQGDYQAAETLLWDYYRALDTSLILQGHPEPMEAEAEYAAALDGKGDRAKADEIYKSLLELFDIRDSGGQENARSEIARYRLASHLVRRGDYEKAAQQYGLAQNHLEVLLGSGHPWAVRSMAERGFALIAAGRAVDGELYVKQAIELGKVDDAISGSERKRWSDRLESTTKAEVGEIDLGRNESK